MSRQDGVEWPRVAIYIRWSTDDQTQGTTLATQLEGCRHYVLSQGWAVRDDGIFVDDGYSGGDLNRPALTRLRRAVRDGQVDCIVVFKLDRLSRNVVDTVKLVLEEWDGRAHVKSAREPVDTGSPHGKVLFYLLASYAEWERSLIRERTHAGQRQRARAGRNPGIRAPYGYAVGPEPGSLRLVPAEAETVRRIFRLAVGGLGARRIAALLNADGVPFRGGRPWQEQTVRYMLQNPLYCGELVYGRRSRNPRYGKVPGEPYWLARDCPIHVPSTPHIPPVVDRGLFQAAQNQRRRIQGGGCGARTGRAGASPHLLTGVATCRCGQGLYVKESRKGARRYYAYACRGKKRGGAACCPAANIPRDGLDAAVREQVQARLAAALDRPAVQARILQRAGQEVDASAAAVRTGRADVARCRRELQRARRDYRQGRLDARAYAGLQAEIERDAAAARARLAAARRRQAALKQHADRLAAAVTSAAATAPPRALTPGGTSGLPAAAISPWAVLAPWEQKALLRALVAGLAVYRPPGTDTVAVEIIWALPGDQYSAGM